MSPSNSQFEWSDFLALGSRLSTEDGASEAALRTAVSRAYYAAFHAARHHLTETRGVSFSKHGGVHDEVIQELRRYRRTLGDSLDRLRKKRRWADYEKERLNALSECTTAVIWAKRIVNELASLQLES